MTYTQNSTQLFETTAEVCALYNSLRDILPGAIENRLDLVSKSGVRQSRV